MRKGRYVKGTGAERSPINWLARTIWFPAESAFSQSPRVTRAARPRVNRNGPGAVPWIRPNSASRTTIGVMNVARRPVLDRSIGSCRDPRRRCGRPAERRRCHCQRATEADPGEIMLNSRNSTDRQRLRSFTSVLSGARVLTSVAAASRRRQGFRTLDAEPP
jgi:hypothetical protein